MREIERDRLTSEELTILVERGAQQGVIEAEEEQMIGAVLELGDRRVHEVMVPRIDIVAIPVTASLDEMVDTIVREGHSRIPVYEQTVDNIIGILYAKDLLPYLKGADSPPTVRKLLRTPLFVPESMQVDDLLHQLQRRKVHIAVVLDEYGGTAGLVTIEDLLEEIVGEIQDEYDTEEPMIVALSETEARIDGRAGVDDLLDHFDLELSLEDRDEYDTIGGLDLPPRGGHPQGRRHGRGRERADPDGGIHRRPTRWQGPGGPASAQGQRGLGGRRGGLATRAPPGVSARASPGVSTRAPQGVSARAPQAD